MTNIIKVTFFCQDHFMNSNPTKMYVTRVMNEKLETEN